LITSTSLFTDAQHREDESLRERTVSAFDEEARGPRAVRAVPPARAHLL